jgi:hypothetical protein
MICVGQSLERLDPTVIPHGIGRLVGAELLNLLAIAEQEGDHCNWG